MTADTAAAVLNVYAAKTGVDLGAQAWTSTHITVDGEALVSFVEALLTATGGRRHYPAADLAHTKER